MTNPRSDPPSYSSDAISGGRWGAVRSVALQGASILTTAVLARFLSNEEFGIVAITVIVLAMFDLITRVGLSASLIRRPEVDERVTSTFFWASVGIGLLAAAMAIALSRPAAALAGSVEAAPLVILAAVTLPLNLAARIPMGLLSRNLRFGTMAVVDVTGSMVHGVVAISLAWLGLGAWAVVIGQVARSGIILVRSLMVSGFRPRRTLDRALIKEDLSFNAGILGGDLVGYANKNADYWFVGNQLGPGPLGLYYVAYVIPSLIRQRITTIGQDVLYPLVSKIQTDAPRIVTGYLRVVRLVSFLVFPVMFGLAVVADLAVQIGFGSDWLGAVTALRIVAVAAAITAISVVANPIFPAVGKPSALVFIGLVALVALAAGLTFSVTDGTLGTVAAAVLVSAVAQTAITQQRMAHMLGMRYRAFLAAIVPFIVSSLLMAAVVWGLRIYAFSSLATVVEAVATVSAGGLTYLLVGALGFRTAFAEQWSVMKKMLWR